MGIFSVSVRRNRRSQLISKMLPFRGVKEGTRTKNGFFGIVVSEDIALLTLFAEKDDPSHATITVSIF